MINMVIKKTSERTWTLYTKKKYKGRRKPLGKFRSLKSAKKREHQIEYFKKRKNLLKGD